MTEWCPGYLFFFYTEFHWPSFCQSKDGFKIWNMDLVLEQRKTSRRVCYRQIISTHRRTSYIECRLVMLLVLKIGNEVLALVFSILFTTDRFEETSPCQRAFFFPSWWDRTRFLFSLKNSVSRRKLWQVDVTCREHASVIFPHQEALEVLHMTLRVEGFGGWLGGWCRPYHSYTKAGIRWHGIFLS